MHHSSRGLIRRVNDAKVCQDRRQHLLVEFLDLLSHSIRRRYPWPRRNPILIIPVAVAAVAPSGTLPACGGCDPWCRSRYSLLLPLLRLPFLPRSSLQGRLLDVLRPRGLELLQREHVAKTRARLPVNLKDDFPDVLSVVTLDVMLFDAPVHHLKQTLEQQPRITVGHPTKGLDHRIEMK